MSELTEDSLSFSDLESQSCFFNVKVKDFSNETVHIPGEEAELAHFYFHGEPSETLETILLDVYANGIASDDEGYVSVVFQMAKPLLIFFYKYFEFSCTFMVIDASESKRFPKSYVFPFHPDYRTDVKNLFPTFTIKKIFKRDVLFSDNDDLLPGDCLSLHIDVTIRTVDYGSAAEIPVEAVVQYSFAREESADGTKYFLYLDSELARLLTEVSAYFRRMLLTPMIERTTRYMNVLEDEYVFLRDVSIILMGKKAITVDSISHICKMYVTADKYDIPIVIESCRNLLITLLRIENDPFTAKHVEENIPTLLELAETYNDVQLKENIEIFLKSNTEENKNERCTDKRLQCDLEAEWKLELVGNEVHSFFTFVKNIKEKPRENFYQ